MVIAVFYRVSCSRRRRVGSVDAATYHSCMNIELCPNSRLLFDRDQTRARAAVVDLKKGYLKEMPT